MKKSADDGSQYPVDTEVYLRRFAIVLKDNALQGCFVPCSSKDKVSMIDDIFIGEGSGSHFFYSLERTFTHDTTMDHGLV